jgi:hypothetical protein
MGREIGDGATYKAAKKGADKTEAKGRRWIEMKRERAAYNGGKQAQKRRKQKEVDG